MQIAELRDNLSKFRGGQPLEVTADSLGFRHAARLFSICLKSDRIRVEPGSNSPSTDEDLTISGLVTLRARKVPCTAKFLASLDGTKVRGVEITCLVEDWVWPSSGVSIGAAQSIATYLHSPKLLLMAHDGAEAPGAFLCGRARINDFVMWAPIYVGEDDPRELIFQGTPDIRLDFDGVKDFVARFYDKCPRLSLPDNLRYSPQFTLSELSVGFKADNGEVTSFSVSIVSDLSLPLLNDKVVIESITITFLALLPPSIGLNVSISTRVHFNLGTSPAAILGNEGIEHKRVATIPIILSAGVPNLFLEGELVGPIPLKPILDCLNAPCPDEFSKFKISECVLGMYVTRPRDWRVRLGLEDLLTFDVVGGKPIVFERLVLDATITEWSMSAQFNIAGLGLRVSGIKSGDCWKLSGGTAVYESIGLDALFAEMKRWLAGGSGEVPEALKGFELNGINFECSIGPKQKTLSFTCIGSVPLGVKGERLRGAIRIDIEPGQGAKFSGTLELGKKKFELVIVKESAALLKAVYRDDQPSKIDIGSIGQLFGSPLSTGLELMLKKALFVYWTDDSDKKCLFCLSGATDINLTSLPVVGTIMPSGLIISIDDIELVVALEAFGKTQLRYLPELGQQSIRKGIHVSAKVRLGEQRLVLPEPTPEQPSNLVRRDPKRDDAKVGPSDMQWLSLRRTIGPVRIERIGMGYENGFIRCVVDASLELANLAFSVQGLGAGLRLSDTTVEFYLDGLGVSFANGPLEISGALIKTHNPPSLRLDGALLIRTAAFSVVALASYADLAGTPSFFAFAVLNKDLGGPAFFFVTGLALGLGINRELKLPDITEVQNFPLIKAAMDPQFIGRGMNLMAISQGLDKYLSPRAGNFWVAAGIKFTSFQQIESFALLSVSFGAKFQIALLGLSKISIPRPPAPIIAYAELALKAVFDPEVGLLSIEARLTEESYIFRPEFKLRGGFALYLWFAGEHEGDFVISLGGYHPRFLPPAHYPKPDLLQFTCKKDEISIEGSCYFALCPSAVMAGGSLRFLYQSGGVKAWFIVYANFLFQWKPLQYDADLIITVGVALNIEVGAVRISQAIELSASLNLYGPPLGGKARLSVCAFTFTVHFGEGKHVAPSLYWESEQLERSFAKSFLPEKGVTSASVVEGLLEEIEQGEGMSPKRLVSAHRMNVVCRTQIPAIDLRFNGSDITSGNWTRHLGVRPMNKTQFYSLLDIRFECNDSTDKARSKQYLEDNVEVCLVKGKVPKALWSATSFNPEAPPEAVQTIDDTLMGIAIRTKDGPQPWKLRPYKLEDLGYETYESQCAIGSVGATKPLAAHGNKNISNTINDSRVVKKRSAIVAILRSTGRNISASETINRYTLERNARYIFQAAPLMARVGQYPPRDYLET